MCGITGIFHFGVWPDDPDALVRAMADRLTHRGPDDAGTWSDPETGIALAHRRLSILDLSPAGHQPMHSACGRYVLVFNGEIYNHLSLRARLEAHAGPVSGWRGSSDTETLLAAVAAWGLEAALQASVGMFALALWDRRECVLNLARDRLGEKPLYYGWTGSGARRVFVFGSELKALRAWPSFANPICREALEDYLRLLYVPAPRTIYRDLYKLEPGVVLTLRTTDAPISADCFPPRAARASLTCAGLRMHRWWDLDVVIDGAADNPLSDGPEALDALEAALDEAVRLQSLADVPLGAFLSGGVDSSLIVALMQRQSARPVKTFTVGFEAAGFDESVHAEAVARHLGTDHQALRVSAEETRALIPSLPWMYDEPFADSSQIPMHLVCRAARGSVTVALSGDGGDELFGGYNRYLWAPRLWRRLGSVPAPLREVLARALRALPPRGWDVLLGHGALVRPGEKLHKLGRVLQGARGLGDVYRNLVSEGASDLLLAGGERLDGWRDDSGGGPDQAGEAAGSLRADGDATAWMMRADTLTYLPDDILCKVDRAAMAISLETRVPFLDHRVLELAWRLPPSMKIRDGQGKWALRQLLYRQVPRALIERPKAGFALPIGQWLRGPLRDWAEALITPSRLSREGYLDAARVRLLWRRHLSGRYDHTGPLWAVLMFQAWLEANP